MECRAQHPKAHCFNFEASETTTLNAIVAGFDVIVCPRGLKTLQHQGGMRFCAVVSSAAAVEKLAAAGDVVIKGVSTPVHCVGPQVVYVTVLRLKPFIADADPGTTLSNYGKVLSISYPTFKGFPLLENGSRLVKMEMKRPVRNFLDVKGACVQCEYRGVKRVCSRCG